MSSQRLIGYRLTFSQDGSLHTYSIRAAYKGTFHNLAPELFYNFAEKKGFLLQDFFTSVPQNNPNGARLELST